ncbi:hypothetical protein PQR05_29280 [Paraburkholderia sediminicola]|uniref:hypothetical protein n=1 Tax=Paraburkholderia sediminicola TaxID=458836 RepID=UPI0038B85BBA
MQNRIRDIVNMVKAFELELIQHYMKNGRACADVRAPNGVESTFSLSTGGGSDPRGDQIAQQKMRRFARANAAQESAAATPPAIAAHAAPIASRNQTPKRTILKTTTKTAEAISRIGAELAKAPVTMAAQDLTPTEFYRLCEWTKQQGTMAAHPNREAIALAATSMIGHTVSEDTIREAMEATEMKEPDHWTPPEEPNVILARELSALMKQLGNEPSPQFSRLLANIAA